MDALQSARARQMWPLLTGALVFALFLLANTLFYAPLAKRYDRALTRAGGMGALFAPERGPAPAAMPPRVYSLLTENSAPAPEADAKAAAGTLGAELVQQISSLATAHHLEIVVAEPGVQTQQPGWNEARAHVRMHGSWSEWVALLDAIARSGRLYRIERFSVAPTASGSADIEMWVVGATLKRHRGTP